MQIGTSVCVFHDMFQNVWVVLWDIIKLSYISVFPCYVYMCFIPL